MDENEEEEELQGFDAQLVEAISKRRKLEAIVQSEDFKFFQELVETQIKKREHEYLVMPGGIDDVVKRIYSSGEIAGLKIASALPRTLWDGLGEEIKLIHRQIEIEEEKKNGQR